MRIYLSILIVIVLYACNSIGDGNSKTDQISTQEKGIDLKADSTSLSQEHQKGSEDFNSDTQDELTESKGPNNEEAIPLSKKVDLKGTSLGNLIEKFPPIEVPFKFVDPDFDGIELTQAEVDQLELYEPVYEAICKIESGDYIILIVNYPIMMSKIYYAVLLDFEGKIRDQLLIYSVTNDETFEFTRSEITGSTIYTEFVSADPDDDYNMIYHDLGKIEIYDFQSGKFDKKVSREIDLTELKLFDIN